MKPWIHYHMKLHDQQFQSFTQFSLKIESKDQTQPKYNHFLWGHSNINGYQDASISCQYSFGFCMVRHTQLKQHPALAAWLVHTIIAIVPTCIIEQ